MAKGQTVLLVDDDPAILHSVERALERHGVAVRTASSAEAALASVSEDPPDVVLSDVQMPSMSGLELLRLLRSRQPEIDVILMSGYDDLPAVAAAMGDGAVDFLVKPLDLHQLWSLVDRLFEDRVLREASGHKTPNEHAAVPKLSGSHPLIVEAFKIAGRVSRTSANVLIRGESGVGKELLARTIHERSPGAAEPFVAVNCASLPETLLESELFGHVRGAFTGAAGSRKGRFELAGKGTILLDEIGDTGKGFQAKLLRVLQEREFFPVGAEEAYPMRARVIAATHVNLEDLVARGSFRQDLYYRLRVVEIELPPLRERMSDLPALAAHLVKKATWVLGSGEKTLSPKAVERLRAADWPGNVRELENCLTRAVLLCSGPVLQPEHLAIDGVAETAPQTLETLEDVEREHVQRVLHVTGGKKKRAAEVLGISRPRLDRLIAKHDLELPTA